MSQSEQYEAGTQSRDSGELAREAEVRRERIGHTLDQLEGRLSPERYMDNAVDLFKEHGGEIADGLQRSIKNNPLPVILTGVGIAWMMMNQRDSRSDLRNSDGQYPAFRQPSYDTRYIPSEAGSESGDGVKEKISSAVQGAGDAVERARDDVSQRIDRLSESAAEASDSARARMSSLQDRGSDASRQMRERAEFHGQSVRQSAEQLGDDASRFMQDQPLVAGALGVALGALLGSLVPTSRKERQLARQVVDSEMGQQVVEQTNEVASKAEDQIDKQLDEVESKAKSQVSKARDSATAEA